LDQYHQYAYMILMLIIFCETGLVVMPFLPGDSLIFATGLAFATTHRPIWILIILLIVAAALGDNCNYGLGRCFGRKLFVNFPRIFKWEYLEKTEFFYAKHGPIAIILARFIPMLRTFIPFFAGLSKMRYASYLFFSILSASFWVCLLGLSSFYFGQIPFVQNHFSLVILLIIIASLIPTLFAFLRNKC
ncbi:MAG: VTT domain-containing protein, partial [Gammaproteobacteria bacterium]|nr:VTT domain-containing protein [Gammaproteobacteria bacterium]